MLRDADSADAAKPLEDAVVRDVLTNHCAEILGLESAQVNEAAEVGHVPKRQLNDKSRFAPFGGGEAIA
jgi:hypothetical protein